MSCLQTLGDYGLRAFGIGQRLLPRDDISLCEQAVLIGSGMLWNIYFAVLALLLGFALAVLITLGRNSRIRPLAGLARGYIFLFRGSPLFIQFFFAYELFVLLPRVGVEFSLGPLAFNAQTAWLTKAWLGALIVLWLNTSAYTAEIFHGAWQSVPRGDLEAARAYGMTPWQTFRRVIWPTMLRLAWPSYTNEAIFLFHATALVFFSSFPAWRQMGDALYYANYFAERTFNPFIPYPIAAAYFIFVTLAIIGVCALINRRLNRHLNPGQRRGLKLKWSLIR